ncbi:acyltransferase [uncultured Cytophaga sp.]|uniref:acyltransferase family protein n=1 Tax=uncultured Cytophaga sp. TaxID=160238 RepID=UPI002618B675|nr:acyltransferase [uncultured Cytophaga sp.]
MAIDRENNFDFLRLVFSCAVIVSHSFPLTNNNEILSVLSNNQIDFGALAVDIFFIISGYLIFNSLKYSHSYVNYIWKRCLRIFPALFVMLIISLGIILIVSTNQKTFMQRDFLTYLPNNLSLYRAQFVVNGVFKNNPYPNAINGSLWTLCYEFSMYIFLLFFFPIRNRKKVCLILLTVFFILFYTGNFVHMKLLNRWISMLGLGSTDMYKLAPFFIAGSILSLFNLKVINTQLVKIVLFCLLILALIFNVYVYVAHLLMPLLIVLIGISFDKYTNSVTHTLGDLSYGIYIYGFIIQQTLMNYFILNTYELMLYSLISTLIIAYFSWHYVEKTSLKFKNQF